MAKQLPKYEQQLKPVADTTALKRDPNLTAQAELAEGAVDAAYASGFASVAKVGAEIAFKVRDTHNDTQRALAAKELEAILAEYPKEAEKQAKEEDLEILKEGVLDRTKKVQEKYENNIYGNKAKKQLGAMGQSTILSIDAIDETAKQGLVDREYAGVLYGMIHDAQDKRKPIPFNPKTGLPFESEILEYEFNEETQEFSEISISRKTESVSARQKAYNYGVRELQLLGEINNRQAATMINEYGYKTNYMSVINEAMINPDEAMVMMNSGDFPMSSEMTLQATKSIQAQMVKRDNEIEKIKTDTADDVNEAIKKDELNYQELAEINEEQTVLGETFKPLSDEFMKVADIKLTSDINTQISASPKEYKAVQDAMKKIAQEISASEKGRPTAKSLKELYKAFSQTKQRVDPDLQATDKRKDLKTGEPIFNRLFIQTHEQIVQEMINGRQNNPNYISSFEYGSDIITTTIGKYFDSAAEKKDFPLITTEIGNKQVAFAKWLADFESKKGNPPSINEINTYMENELLSYMSSNAYDDVIKKLQSTYGTDFVTATVEGKQVEYDSIMDMPIDSLVSAIQMDFNETPYVIDEATRYLKEIQ
jgi:hypothetical protein